MPDALAGLAAGFLRRLLAGGERFGDRLGEPVGAVRRADRDAVLRVLAGQETPGRLVEGDLAARLREQVHRRRPAGRHQDRVDRDGALRSAVLGLHRHRRHAQPAAGADDGAAVVDLDAERARLVDRRTGRIVADVDDAGDVDAGLLQVDRRRIGGIVGRVDADILADRDAVVVEIGARRRGQHDARPVVVGKHHVPLDRAGGDDHAPGAHLPQPLARQLIAGRGEMVADPLDQRRRNSARSSRRPWCAAARGHCPSPQAWRSRACAQVQPSSPSILAPVSKRSAPPNSACSSQTMTRTPVSAAASAAAMPAAPPPEHQHLAMRIARRIVVGIGLVGRHAEAGRGADVRLVDALPGRLRPHEGLVVEAGRKHRRRDVVDRADVEGERRPAVLRDRVQPVIELLHGGPHVRRLARGVALDRHQRIGLLGAGRQDAARPMVLERAADQMDVVGDQRRGQRVALRGRRSACRRR